MVRIPLSEINIFHPCIKTQVNIHDYPLMQSPVHPVAIVALYVLFVFRLGPKLMKNRQPSDLRKILMVYNITQILLNFIVFIMVSFEIAVVDAVSVVCFKVAKVIPNFDLCCSPANRTNTSLDISVRRIHYYYALLKFLDLLDTVGQSRFIKIIYELCCFRSFLSCGRNHNRSRTCMFTIM
jgi:hypothetical protein